ncbi:hypothetical protein SMACR_12810 [Sordaria macrospora]|uniref:WGS project CABT00000000 data, contig 2.67 n=2 Tax=Sordaria macrospora TaxID=5147 RepID=F7WAX9_SORMK|nr:uncharacterized protein SMAC_12810 [Sordaria macrospora k-hell]KAA8628360.1 hypothetical protein SMACR_12810 [Sordaria macrospora]WPJ64294.1 hypothetical protein SMAC4_12810 [Sordaria macrospora]CCC14294.1 unnamed protein product [Sordaria macrospora k-hell]
MAASHIESQLGFLKRNPIYNTVKPYSLRYDPEDGTPRQNIETDMVPVTINDARSLRPTIEQHGFALTSIPTAMTYDDFFNQDKIDRVYAAELQSHLKTFFNVPHVRVIDYAVRRRHPEFPVSTGRQYEHQQPAALVHLDFSHEEAVNMLETLYGCNASQVLKHRWQIINVWRPLKGPLYDWPLAVCDAQTFTRSRDSQSADAVYPESVYENVLVHHHPSQQWYYFPGLLETETMLFKCTDSDTTASGPSPHAAFPLPRTAGTSNSPRESIESRAFILWAPLEQLPQEVGPLYGKRG